MEKEMSKESFSLYFLSSAHQRFDDISQLCDVMGWEGILGFLLFQM